MHNWTLIILGVLAVLVLIILVRKGSGQKETDVVQASSPHQDAPAAPMATGSVTGLADAELIAVIAAAIAASTGQSMDGFVVKRISRLSGHIPAWGVAGRQECVDSRRM